MSTFKRFLSLVVALVMVIGMVPATVFATGEEIQPQSGATVVTTVDDLVAALKAGGEVKLGGNIEWYDVNLCQRDYPNGPMILDLNGHTIKNNHLTVQEGIDLTVKDSVGTGGITVSFAISVERGNLTIAGGNFSGGKDYLINVGGGSRDDLTTLTITGGTFTSTPGIPVVQSFNGKKATISGGTFTSQGSSVLYNKTQPMDWEISGGTFTCQNGSVFFNNYADNVNVTISGGTFTAKDLATAANSKVANITVTGGNFTGVTNADNVKTYLAEGYTLDANGTVAAPHEHSFANGGATCDGCEEPNPDYVAPTEPTEPEVTYVAKIGEQGYETLAAAVAAANTAGTATVTMLTDVTLGEKLTISGNVTISGGKITRDAAYAGTLFEVAAGAKLTLDGGLTIDGGNNWVYTKGTPELDMANGAGTMVANHITPAEGGVNATAHLIVNKGTLDANDVTIQNSYSTNGVSAIECGASSVTTLNGATMQNIAANRSGAVVYVGGADAVLTIKGETRITGNFGTGNGGIIQNYGQGTTVNMEGGSIDNNHVGKSGTVYASYSGNANKRNTFNMSGGIITKNVMEGYGPVYIHTNTKWNMTGGEISENTSLLPNYVRSGNEATISGGKILNNTITGLNFNSGYYLTRQDIYLSKVSNTGITGGTYTQDVSEYLDDDYSLAYDDVNNVYYVVEGPLYRLHLTDPATGEAPFVPYVEGNGLAALVEHGKLFYANYYEMELEVLYTSKVKESVVIDYPMTINLNGKSIIGGNDVYPVIRVQGGATVTVQGGTIKNEDYVFVLGASDGSSAGNLVINSGSYEGETTVASVTKGTLTINGGEFSISENEAYDYAYLLNCVDANYLDGSAKIEVKGGNFYKFNPENNAAEGANTNFCASGYKAEADGDYYTVVDGRVFVAQVGAEKYETLKAAVEAANAVEGGATVTMLADVTLGEKLTISGDVTIEGAHTITRADNYTGTLFTVNAGAALTLDGGLVVDGNNNWSIDANDVVTPEAGKPIATGFMFDNAGTLNVYKATLQNQYSEGTGSSTEGAIIAQSNSVTNLVGATIQHFYTQDAGSAVRLGHGSTTCNNATLNIGEGTNITGNIGDWNGALIITYGTNTINMTGGSINNNTANSNGTLIMLYKGTMNMSGGVITENKGPVPAIYMHYLGKFVMTGGEISKNTGGYALYVRSNADSVSISGKNSKFLDNKIYVSATKTDAVDITGGIYSQDVTEWLAPNLGLAYYEEDGKPRYEVTTDIAEVNGVVYHSVAAAVEKANAGDTVKVLNSHKVGETVVINKNIKLDLNEKTLYGYGTVNPIIRVLADVTVTGKGMIDTANYGDGYCFIVGDSTGKSGKLTIENGTFKGNASAASVTAGELHINGGIFEVIPYDGSYEFTLNCVDSQRELGLAKIFVKGGKFFKFNPENNAAEGAGTDFVPDGYAVKVDGDYYIVYDARVYVAKIGDKKFEKLFDAFVAANAAGTATITLLENTDEVIDLALESDRNITLDGNGKTFTGKITLMGTHNETDGWNLTVENLNGDSGEFVLDHVGVTVTGAAGLNVTSGLKGYEVVYENDGVYKLARKIINVTVTVDDVTMVEGNARPAFTYKTNVEVPALDIEYSVDGTTINATVAEMDGYEFTVVPGTLTVRKALVKVENDGKTVFFDSLEAAMEYAVPLNGAVKIYLLGNIEVKETIKIADDRNNSMELQSIKLGANTVTLKSNFDGPMFQMESGLLGVKNVKIDAKGDAFYVTGGTLNLNYHSVGSQFIEVTSQTGNCVYIRGGKVNVNGAKLTSLGKYPAIQGNGAYAGDVAITKWSIGNGIYPEISAPNSDIAIYWPQNGNLTVDGGTIIGDTALYVKSGTVVINGGEFIGDGEAKAFAHSSNGATATGDAVVIESCVDGAYETPSFTVNNGKFISKNAEAVMFYDCAGSKKAAAVMELNKGGIYSSEPAGEWCAPGCFPGQNADGTWSIKDVVTITIHNQEMVAGNAVPELTYTIDYANIEGLEVKLYVDGDTAVAGEYEIKATATDANNTYVYNIVNGKMTVKKALISVGQGNSGTSVMRYFDDLNAALQDAYSRNHASVAVKLLGNVTVNETIVINDNDKVANTIEMTSSDLSKNFTITATGSEFIKLEKGTLCLKSLNINAQNDAFYVTGGTLELRAYGSAHVLNITSETGNCVYTRGGTTNVLGATLTSKGAYPAIQGNGNYAGNVTIGVWRNKNTTSTISAPNSDITIYWPQNGTLTVSAGTITGKTAVYAKSGTINISGGNLIATGDAKAFEHYSNGAYATGDAVVIEACKDTAYEAPTVTVTGGTFTSANAKGIMFYDCAGMADNGAAVMELSGGTYTGKPEQTWCKTGYTPIKSGENTWTIKEFVLADIAVDSITVVDGNAIPEFTYKVTINGEAVELEGLNVALATTTEVNGVGEYEIKATVGELQGYQFNVTNGKLTVQEAVAEIDGVNYASIRDAVKNAKTGDTVKVLKDHKIDVSKLTESSVVFIDGRKVTDLTIDFNGKTLTADTSENSSGNVWSFFYGRYGANVTFKGNGNITIVGDNANRPYLFWASASTFTVEDGTYFMDGTNGTNAVSHTFYASSAGHIYIKDGFYGNSNSKQDLMNIKDSSQSTITVTGGTYTEYFPNTEQPWEVTVPAGYTIVDNSDGTWTVKPLITVTFADQEMIEGNTVPEFTYTSEILVPFEGSENLVVEKPVVEINGAGEYEITAKAYVDGSDKYAVVVESGTLTVKKAVAQVNGVNYASLADAVEAAEDDDTVKLIAENVLTAYCEINKSIILDLNGYSIVREGGTALYVNGDVTMTIQGEGEVSGDQALYIDKGTVVIESGSFKGVDHAVYVINNGKAEINGGVFSSENNSFVLNEYDATRNDTDIVVKGGTFVGFNPADNKAEGEHTNFLADGYCAKADGENYIVQMHSYQAVVTEPTCEGEGYTTYTCEHCGDVYTDDEVAALGHDWSAWEYVDENSHKHTCKNDAAHVESVGHKIENGKCADCGHVFTIEVTVTVQNATKVEGNPDPAFTYETDVELDFELNITYTVDGTTINATVAEMDGYEFTVVPGTLTVQEAVAKAAVNKVTTYFASLQEAYDKADSRVDMLTDIVLTETLKVTRPKTMSIYTNGKNLSGDLATLIEVDCTSGGLTISSSGKITNTGDVFFVNKGNVTIYGACEIISEESNCIYVRGGKTTIQKAILVANGEYPAIQGNGIYAGDVTISGGSVSAPNTDIAIYWPQNGALSISGGTITGETAVYAKSGKINISGGEFIANGVKADFVHSSNGAVATGDAVVIEACKDTAYETPVVTISGGKFYSENANAVMFYDCAETSNAAGVMELTGGVYSSMPDAQWCAEGKGPKHNDDEKYPWTIGSGILTVDGVRFDSWDEAKSSIKKNSNVVLYGDVANHYNGGDVAKDFHFPTSAGTITIELNGHKFTSKPTGESKIVTMTIPSNTTVVFKDSVGGGVVHMDSKNYPLVLSNAGKVVFEDDVQFIGNMQFNRGGNAFIDDVNLIGLNGIYQIDGITRVTIAENGDWTLASGKLTMTADDDYLAENSLTIAKDYTLDLNGHNLTAKNVTVFGTLIDTTDGTGSVVSGNLWFNGHDNSGYMPLKDGDCYRLFAVVLDNRGVKPVSGAPDKVKAGFTVRFNKVEAYDLMSASVQDGSIKATAIFEEVELTDEKEFTKATIVDHLGRAKKQLVAANGDTSAVTAAFTGTIVVKTYTIDVFAEVFSSNDTNVIIGSQVVTYPAP